MISNKRIYITLLACAAIIAVSLFAWHARKGLQIAEKERERLAAQITALKAQIKTSEGDLEQIKTEWSAEHTITTSEELSALYAAALARSIAMTEAYHEAQVKRMNDPKYQELFYKGREAGLNTLYGVFLTKNRLTPDQKTALLKALTQREMDKDDLKLALEGQGLPANDPSGLPLKQESDDAFQQAVEAVIGAEGFAQMETYDRQYNIRQVMSRYAAGSALIGSPMSLNQVEQMIDYISQNNPDFQDGKTVNSSQIDWDAVDEYARKNMTPEQFD